MTQFELHQGDCLEVMKTLPDNSVDSIVTDPPYGISFMGKKWDYDVPGVDVWAEALRLLKPGGHILVACGTRTQHRMVVNIEDAGFEIRDTVAWIYGSGFPKSLDVSKAIDKVGGRPDLIVEIGQALKSAREARGMTASECDRIFCGGSTNWSWFEGRPRGQRCPTPDTFKHIATLWPELKHLADAVAEVEREIIGVKAGSLLAVAPGQINDRSQTDLSITTGKSLNAKAWDGWGTALKPAMELWTLARKPLIGTVAQNVLAHGTGGLNIDGCRIAGENPSIARRKGKAPGVSVGATGWVTPARPAAYNEQRAGEQLGRWPANVILDEEAGAMLDAQTGVLTSGKPGVRRKPHQTNAMAGTLNMTGEQETGFGDSGGASRFFYCAKASKSDRNGGLDGFPVDRPDSRTAIGMGTFEEKGVQPQQNHHPTVKPTALMQYLCRLITPPGGTVLDPYTGSGSTGKAAMFEDFRFIGIERELEYVEIATARIEAARTREPLFLEADSQKTQGGLF